ncbi:MAG TPA: pilus assembly protein TadG-related protein [Terracidiphilus sp.]|nr:pilus assembly protein TadG-related protein [Terracidiphilus sp.]
MRMRIQKSESGQVLAITILCMTTLLACVALAVDISTLFLEQRRAQTAADSAAIAGAMNLQYATTVDVTGTADTAASNNGFASGDVTVLNPPTDGYHTSSGYVEVKVIHSTPTTFMSMFGLPTVNVGARAVAGTTPSQACMYVLDPTDDDSFYIKGNSNLIAPKCGIQVNSKSPDAACVQGSASIEAPFLHIVGQQSSSGKCGKNPGAPVSGGVNPLADPFKNLKGPPTVGSCGSTSSATSITGNVAGPGNGSSVCYSNAVTINGATLGAGLYVFENGVTLSGTVNVNGGTLDVEQGGFSQGNATLNITAPTSGTYNGIAVMVPQTNTKVSCGNAANSMKITAPTCLQLQFGSGSGNLTGIIYAPWTAVFFQDEGGGVQAAAVIAYQFDSNSAVTLTDNYSDANPSTTPLTKVTLVE